MGSKVLNLLGIIVGVVNLDLELLALLKVEVKPDLRNPLRVQVVVNDLRLA